MFLNEKSHKEPVFLKHVDFAVGSLLLSFTHKFWFPFPPSFRLENSPMLAFCTHLLPGLIQVLLEGVMSEGIFCVPDAFPPLL